MYICRWKIFLGGYCNNLKFKQLNINNMKKSLFLKSSILLMFLFCGVFGLNAQSVLFSEAGY